jgi:hypothetical protein
MKTSHALSVFYFVLQLSLSPLLLNFVYLAKSEKLKPTFFS